MNERFWRYQFKILATLTYLRAKNIFIISFIYMNIRSPFSNSCRHVPMCIIPTIMPFVFHSITNFFPDQRWQFFSGWADFVGSMFCWINDCNRICSQLLSFDSPSKHHGMLHHFWNFRRVHKQLSDPPGVEFKLFASIQLTIICWEHHWVSLFGSYEQVLQYSEARLMLSLVNVICRLMWLHFNVPFTIDYKIKIIGYCYPSVTTITFGLAQSDLIKRLPLHYIRHMIVLKGV